MRNEYYTMYRTDRIICTIIYDISFLIKVFFILLIYLSDEISETDLNLFTTLPTLYRLYILFSTIS